VRRTAEMIATLKTPEVINSLRDPDSAESDQPSYAKNETRSLKPEYLVLIGVCTHLGCAPMDRFQPQDPELGATWRGGF